MTLEAKASLEKQPDWIYDLYCDMSGLFGKLLTEEEEYPMFIKRLQKHLPQESLTPLTQENPYQKTTVPNVLLYETGYKQGREDMKKEIRKVIKTKSANYDGMDIILTQYLESILSPTDTK